MAGLKSVFPRIDETIEFNEAIGIYEVTREQREFIEETWCGIHGIKLGLTDLAKKGVDIQTLYEGKSESEIWDEIRPLYKAKA